MFWLIVCSDLDEVTEVADRILAKSNISVQRLIQIPDHKKKTASIVIITHEANERNSKKCLKSFKANKNILKNPVLIRLF